MSSAFGEDLLRDGEVRAVLLEEIAGADRVVLLGDVVEMREMPLEKALERSRPFFEELGAALAGRPVILVPGNHDHRLAEPLLERAALGGEALGLERRVAPSGDPLARIDGWLGDAELEIAYPGVWLRDDVYATHGHYMDCHMTLPRLECLAAALVARGFGPLPDPASPTDYERILRPVYGLSFSLAQASLAQRATRPSEAAWRRLTGRDRSRGAIRRAAIRAAIGAGVPGTVWTVNRLLRSDFEPALSAEAISRSGIDAASELVHRLGVDAAHVLTGHTHRAGPGRREPEWELPGGGRLHNTGSWVFATAFHHPGTPPGPYWPGTVTWLDRDGPPRRVRLLRERSREELLGIVRRLASRPTA